MPNDRIMAAISYFFYIPLYLTFGLLPSLIWLLFYLEKDKHPESNKTIIKVFLWGIGAAAIAVIIQIVITLGIGALVVFAPINTAIPSFALFILHHLIVIALVEEVSKFLVVRKTAVNKAEFDEPVDAMLYMVIAALGFAAIENLLYLFSALFGTESASYLFSALFGAEGARIASAAVISGFRFIGATFLHALASGTIGFFLALSFFRPAKKIFYLACGIISATLLHASFNIFIIGLGESILNENTLLASASAACLIILLISLGIFVGLGFKKLKKLSSVCNYEPKKKRK